MAGKPHMICSIHTLHKVTAWHWSTESRIKRALRVFGCKAFAMTANALKKTNRLQRLNPKAWIGYLVGYNSTNVYRIWNPVFNKIVLTRDVVFNEHETFNGSIEALKDDIRELDLEELSRLLQEHAVLEETGEGEEIPVQPAQEELEEVRDLIEDEIQVQPESNEQSGTDQSDKTLYTEAQFIPYPTPAPSPPAAMLAVSIRSPQSEELPKNE